MKRTVTDIIRRGFDNVVANWPLVLIRIAEGILMIIIVVIAIIAAVVPMVMSLGLNKWDPKSAEEVSEFILNLIIDQWMLLVYLALLITFLLLVYVTIHAFVEAGCARTYVDGERANTNTAIPAREQFHVFTAERWFAGARAGFGAVFWIYNVAWAVSGLIILAPFALVAVVALALQESPAMAIGVGCVGLAISLLWTIAVAVVTYIWCQKAIVVAVARGSGATRSLSASWAEFKADAGRHLGVTLILFILMIVGSGVLSSMSMTFGWHDSPGFNFSMLPLQLITQVVSTVFSSFMTSWFLACFAALSVEPRR